MRTASRPSDRDKGGGEIMMANTNVGFRYLFSSLITPANTLDMRAVLQDMNAVIFYRLQQNSCFDKGCDFPEIEGEYL